MGGRGLLSFLLATKVKICGVEVWSSEVEVKLLEGHGGEGGPAPSGTPSLPPNLTVPIFRDVSVGSATSPGGSRRVDPLTAATTQLRRS